MKNIIISALAALTLISCGIEYNGRERLRILAEVQDSNMNFVEGIELKVINEVSYYSETISIGYTKTNGSLELVFPATKSEEVIYSLEFTDTNHVFAPYRITNIRKTDFDNYQLILDPQILYRYSELVNLRITRNQINPNRSLDSTNIIGIKYLNGIDFQNGAELPDYYNLVHKVFKNQTVILEYSIIDSSTQPWTIENFSVPIEIYEEDVTFIIDL